MQINLGLKLLNNDGYLIEWRLSGFSPSVLSWFWKSFRQIFGEYGVWVCAPAVLGFAQLKSLKGQIKLWKINWQRTWKDLLFNALKLHRIFFGKVTRFYILQVVSKSVEKLRKAKITRFFVKIRDENEDSKHKRNLKEGYWQLWNGINRKEILLRRLDRKDT